MRTVNMHDAKTQLSKLVTQAAAGETILIARSGRPIARLVALADEDSSTSSGRVGFLAGRVAVPDDFDTMAAEHIAEAFSD